ncbi:MAG: hypothetical protein ACE37H_11940 [Phycisphaeraceae bacterium]
MNKPRKHKNEKFPGELLRARVYLREHELMDSPLFRKLDELCATDFINESSWPAEMLVARVRKHQAQQLLDPQTIPFKTPKLPDQGICLGESVDPTDEGSL